MKKKQIYWSSKRSSKYYLGLFSSTIIKSNIMVISKDFKSTVTGSSITLSSINLESIQWIGYGFIFKSVLSKVALKNMSNELPESIKIVLYSLLTALAFMNTTSLYWYITPSLWLWIVWSLHLFPMVYWKEHHDYS